MARRRGSARRRRRGGSGFLYKLLSVLLICGCLVAAITLFFRVDTVVITGEKRYTEAEIREVSGVKDGDNLFLLNKYQVIRNIAEALPYVELEETRVQRKLPDTLLIEIKECGDPLAWAQDGTVWLVSPGGKIVEQRNTVGDYPTIDGCRLLAPSVGTLIALDTENDTRWQSLLELLAALEAAEEMGIPAHVLTTYAEGESRDYGTFMASLAHEVVKNERPFRAPCFLFSAGETTTAIPDSSLIRGHGGPSQEMTAAFAVAAEGLKNVCLLSMDSEGTDGTTPVAGGLTDGTTGTAAAERGIDLRKALREHAAYEALEPLGDTVLTGNTGTNLCDFNVLYIGTQE